MSSNNENFVIRNGLEVANSLLYVDDLQNKVGIGTTQLTELLTVSGGIAATSVSVAQTISAYIGSFTNLNTSGISSLGNVTIGGATDLIVNGTTSFAGIVTVGSGSSAITFNPNTDTITSQNINVVGVLTSSTINVGGGVTIDSSGIYANTFYGDGTGLYGVVNAGGMTIYYNGSPVGYAATIIDFTGTGISTVPFSAGIATVTVDIPSVIGDIIVSGIATITSADIGSLNVSGITSVANLYSSGITTLGITSATSINVSGITTTNSLNIGTTQVVSSARQLQNIASLDAVTTSTIESAIANSPNDFTNLNVSGIATLGIVNVSSGIITATSGIVTYYGDGSKLSGLPQLGIGIQSAGAVIGGGVTTLNFIGTGNTFAINGTTVDISIQSGVSTQWQSINLGIVTTTKVGIGTTNPRFILEVGSVGTSVTTCYVNGDINSSGIKVFGDTTITGISTLGTVQVSSGIITATSGIVTYYGDGSNLTGITTTKIVSGTSNLTVDSSGGPISATVGGQNVFNVAGTGVTMTDGKRFDVSSYSENVQQLGSVSGAVNLDIGTYSVFIADISGTNNVTFQYQSGSMVNGRLFSGTLILRFSGTGTRDVSLTSLNPKYIGGSGPTYSDTDGKTDIISFFTPDNGATTYVNVVGQGFV
jgi:hypothetical protein